MKISAGKTSNCSSRERTDLNLFMQAVDTVPEESHSVSHQNLAGCSHEILTRVNRYFNVSKYTLNVLYR